MAHLRKTADIDLEELYADLDEWERRERENDIPEELKTIEGYGDGWRDVPDYPNYKASVYGELYSKRDNKIMSLGESEKGYLQVMLYKNGVGKTMKVHDIIARTFLPNPENKPEVNHKNGYKQNNRIDNLEWCTHKENMIHAYANGLVKMPDNGRHPKKKVRIVETGQIFESISDCARYLKSRTGDISACLKGKRKTSMGYHFEEVVDDHE